MRGRPLELKFRVTMSNEVRTADQKFLVGHALSEMVYRLGKLPHLNFRERLISEVTLLGTDITVTCENDSDEEAEESEAEFEARVERERLEKLEPVRGIWDRQGG